jgi:hypothetical protein
MNLLIEGFTLKARKLRENWVPYRYRLHTVRVPDIHPRLISVALRLPSLGKL